MSAIGKKIAWGTFLSSSFFCFTVMSHPKIIIHTDINKTIIAEDPAGEKTLDDVLAHALAEVYTDYWSPELQEPMSYTVYIKRHVLPGNKGDATVKKLRNKKIAEFIDFLHNTQHPRHHEIAQRFQALRTKITQQEHAIFKSFFRIIDHCESNHIPFSIVLRTFGKDLDRIIDEINCHLGKPFFSWRGIFTNGELTVRSLTDSTVITFHTTHEIYDFLQTHGHIALQDDWKTWNGNGEHQEFGKLFPIDVHDKSTVSLFLDDNGAPCDGILNPRHPHTNAILNTQELITSNYICVVDMLHAIEDDEYYVKIIKQLLESKPTNS